MQSFSLAAAQPEIIVGNYYRPLPGNPDATVPLWQEMTDMEMEGMKMTGMDTADKLTAG